jgi:hypothetical protein
MLVAAVLLALASAAPTEGAAPAAPVEAEAGPHKKSDEMVCITKTKMGTRFKERVCFDKAEYRRRQDEERKAIDRMQRIPYQGS